MTSNFASRNDARHGSSTSMLLPFSPPERPTSTERRMAANDLQIQLPSTDQLATSPLDFSGEHARRPFLYQDRLIVRSIGRVIFVRTKEIEWCQACENYIQIHSGRHSHLLRATMMQMEAQLDPGQFVRISRSAIVNLNFVREIRSVPTRGRVVRLISGTEINVGREYRARLKKILTSSVTSIASE